MLHCIMQATISGRSTKPRHRPTTQPTVRPRASGRNATNYRAHGFALPAVAPLAPHRRRIPEVAMQRLRPPPIPTRKDAPEQGVQ